MTLDELLGTKLNLALAAAAASPSGASREPLYQALLVEPVGLLHVTAGAPPGPSVRLGTDAPPTRLIEAPLLRVPVVPLFASAVSLRAAALARGLWPDGVEHASVVEAGKVFGLLRGHPGALIVVDEATSVALDAGEIAALAEGKTPDEYVAALRLLITRGRAREVARALATRSLYVLGHPRGGMLLIQRDLPAFLHLRAAEQFAARIAAQTGDRAEHGLVAAADLFKHAWTGRLSVVINPGPGSLTLRSTDLR